MYEEDRFFQDRSRWSLSLAAALMLAAAVGLIGQLHAAQQTAGLHDPEIWIEADTPPPAQLKLVCNGAQEKIAKDKKA